MEGPPYLLAVDPLPGFLSACTLEIWLDPGCLSLDTIPRSRRGELAQVWMFLDFTPGGFRNIPAGAGSSLRYDQDPASFWQNPLSCFYPPWSIKQILTAFIGQLIAFLLVNSSFGHDSAINTGPPLRITIWVGKLPSFNPQSASTFVNYVSRVSHM